MLLCCYYSPGRSKNNVPFFILKVPLGSDKNVPYIGFTSPTRFNKKFSELNYNYKHYFTISSSLKTFDRLHKNAAVGTKERAYR